MNIFTYIKSHAVLATSVAVVAVIGTAVVGRIITAPKTTDTGAGGAKQVSLVPASNFRSDSSIVGADGNVESVSQADLKVQISAPVSNVAVAVGDTVYAGQVLLELQNADIRAQLDQAKASLALAKGQYLSGGVSVETARRSAVDKIRDSYIKADDAVHGQVDQLLYNNVGGVPQLSSYNIDPRLDEKIRAERIDLNSLFRDWKTTIDGLSDSSSEASINAALTISKTNVAKVSVLLDDISIVINNASKIVQSSNISVIEGWKATFTSARSSISLAGSSLTAAEGALSSAQTSYQSPAEAQVSVAEAGVKNLEAQVAKTIIRSPISGTVAGLPLRTGELASAGQLVATVVGGGGLKVKAYVSGGDFSRIHKGGKVTIGKSVQGTVSNIAPSVNQINKKVEVNISITDPDHSGLVVGQSVQVAIQADKIETSSTNANAQSAAYILPIQNVKIIPGDAFVYTVDANSKIKKNAVVLGPVHGDFIEVISGLTDDMSIVTPVYELEEGDTVQVH